MTLPVLDRAAVAEVIRAKILEIARSIGVKAANVTNTEVIPETGLLDSAGILELIVWYETTYGLSIDQGDLTIDNFGTIDAMVRYLERQ